MVMRLKQLISYINKNYDVDIMSKKRTRLEADLRFVYFAAVRDFYPKATYMLIGESVNRDYSSVLHGVKVYENVLSKIDDYNSLYIDLIDILNDNVNLEARNVMELKRIYENRILALETKIFELESKKNKPTDHSGINAILDLSFEDLHIFTETRIKPFLKLKQTEQKHKKIINIKGALIKLRTDETEEINNKARDSKVE